ALEDPDHPQRETLLPERGFMPALLIRHLRRSVVRGGCRRGPVWPGGGPNRLTRGDRGTTLRAAHDLFCPVRLDPQSGATLTALSRQDPGLVHRVPLSGRTSALRAAETRCFRNTPGAPSRRGDTVPAAARGEK